MGNPSVRFDEGRERVGHWPLRLSIQPFPPTLLQPFSPISLGMSGFLSGDGTVGDIFCLSGNVAPGTSPGVLTSSNLTFGGSADFFIELNGPNPGAGYDQLNVRGTNQLGGAKLHLSVGFPPVEGEEFVILNNDGSEPIVGTFAGLPNGSIATANGLQFRIRYFDAFNNDVILTLTNTAARLLSTTISGGNGDGNVDVNECNFLSVILTNVVAGGTISGITGALIPKTPGISVTAGVSAYPNLPAGGRGTNTTPFHFSTAPGFVCGTRLDFELILQTATNGSFTIPFSLPSGSASRKRPWRLRASSP